MITKKKIIIGAFFLLGFFLVILYTGRVNVAVTNQSLKKDGRAPNTLLSRLTGGTVSSISEGEVLDPATGIFLSKRALASEEAKKEILRYVNQANAAIPLSTEALQFALIEVVIGEYEPLEDAVRRLEEGKLALEQIEPPIGAIAFHAMSLALLEEYRNVLLIPLDIPREEFDPSQLEDDFERLDGLVGIAKQELQLLKNTYAVPLFPEVIRFYDEAIGLKKR